MALELSPPIPTPEASNDDAAESTNGDKSTKISDVRHELEELMVLSMSKNNGLRKGLPEGALHTDCARALMDQLAVHYAATQKKGGDEAADLHLENMLEILARDSDDGVVAKLFERYAIDTKAAFDGRTFQDGNSKNQAKVVVRKKDGSAEFPVVFRSAVHALCQEMASRLRDFHFSTRIQLRSIVRTSVDESVGPAFKALAATEPVSEA